MSHLHLALRLAIGGGLNLSRSQWAGAGHAVGSYAIGSRRVADYAIDDPVG